MGGVTARPAHSIQAMDGDPVVEGLLTAISRKRLKPGAKLGEESLAAAFGTTRMHVRQVLAYLASRKIVAQVPNRGAFVHRPSWQEARDIFAVRRVIEAAAVEGAIQNLDERAREAIGQHMVRESIRDQDDRGASLSLTAEFHVLLAKLSGNAVLLDVARELTLRTSLAIATFEPPGSHDCSPDAHPDIASLIMTGDRAGASRAMARHLEEMETRLRPHSDPPEDLNAILGEIGATPARGRARTRRTPSARDRPLGRHSASSTTRQA